MCWKLFPDLWVKIKWNSFDKKRTFLHENAREILPEKLKNKMRKKEGILLIGVHIVSDMSGFGLH